MSTPHLPDDLNRWPKDPYELLGVPRGVDPRELRRVYTRLIRAYKPEQHPDHFRRIREAYEIVLHYAQFYPPWPEAVETNGTAGEPAPVDSSPVTNMPAEPPETISVFPRQIADSPPLEVELDQLWERACKGEEESAYRRLMELHDQRPGRNDILLRLYWLLYLTPSLDARRSPCDWLMQGFRTQGFTGPLRELYRRELVDNPAEAVSERCTRLFKTLREAGQLADLAEWRWLAAGRFNDWQLIDDDLEYLYDHLAAEHDEIWVRCLIGAADQLAAQPRGKARELAQECMKQIAHYPHWEGRLGHDLDRLEFHLKVAEALDDWDHNRPRSGVYRRLAPLLQLVRLSLCRPPAEVRHTAWPYLQQVAQNPREALLDLDGFNMLGQVSPVLHQFGNLLLMIQDSLPREAPESRSAETLVSLVRDYVNGRAWNEYHHKQTRSEVLAFCLREAIAPESIAEILAGSNLAHQILADQPLRCVYLACRLFNM